LGSSDQVKIEGWDYSFYQNILMETEFQVDDIEIQNYFPIHKVTEGLLGVYQEILGLRFEEISPSSELYIQTWHEDVRLFGVWDSATNEFLGNFFLDLHPRDGKYSHAACFPLQIAHTYEDGSRQHTVVAMVTNFTKPTPDRPSLLKHSEVKTFFHEFGHVMHAICSANRFSRLNWTWSAVEQDFLEAPSMMLENWVWQKEVLSRISEHHVTKEPLPDHLLTKMVKAKNADAGYHYERLTFMSLYDMIIHTTNDLKLDEEFLVNLWENLKLKHTKVEHTKGTFPPTWWQHLTTGYDAGYYGYLWSLVFSVDMFTIFEEKGVLSSDVGKQFRKFILEPCARDDGEAMLANFLQRNPSEKAFQYSIFK